jgi:hypothetical protein
MKSKEINELVNEMKSVQRLIKDETSTNRFTMILVLATASGLSAGFMMENFACIGVAMMLARGLECSQSIEKSYNRSYPISTLSIDVLNKTNALLTKLHDLEELTDVDITSSIDTFLTKLSLLISAKTQESDQMQLAESELQHLQKSLEKLGILRNINNPDPDYLFKMVELENQFEGRVTEC